MRCFIMDKQAKNETMNTNLYILKSLENGEKYGYEIIELVNKLSYNKLEIKQATLYASLKRLEQKKLINSYWKDSDIGGKRHYYFITDAGRKFLSDSNYDFSSYNEIINEELSKIEANKNVEMFDMKELNNKDSKAFWTENKYLTSTILNKPESDNANKTNKIHDLQKSHINESQNNITHPTSIVKERTFVENNVDKQKESSNVIKSNSVATFATLDNLQNKNNDESLDCERNGNSISSVNNNIKHTPYATIYVNNNVNSSDILDDKGNKPNKENYSSLQKKNDSEQSVNSNRKYDAVILGQDEKIEANEEAYSMQNRPFNNISQTTDIDYKNILGELYGDKETFKSKLSEKDESFSKHEYLEDSYALSQNEGCQLNDGQNSCEFEDVQDYNNLEIENQQQFKIKNIANNFSNYKIKVKPHNKLYKVEINSDDFIKTNKLNFVASVVSFSFCALLIILSGICLNNLKIADSKDIFAICLGVSALYPIAMLVIYLLNGEKKSKNTFNFKNTIAITALSCLVVMIFIIAICLLCGMTNLNQAKYIYFWLIPAIVFLSIVVYPIIKELLIKSKKFNC